MSNSSLLVLYWLSIDCLAIIRSISNLLATYWQSTDFPSAKTKKMFYYINNKLRYRSNEIYKPKWDLGNFEETNDNETKDEQ